MFNIFDRNLKLKNNSSIKKRRIIEKGTDAASLHVDKNNKISQMDHQNIKNQINFFINAREKDQSLPYRKNQSDNTSGKPPLIF